jgi:hypothetical protein
MPRKKAATRVDPELLRQLDATAPSREPVQAVFRLRVAGPAAPPPERIEAVTRELLARVAAKVGVRAQEVNVFRQLGAFVVVADASYIRQLLSEPEVASAAANVQPTGAFIPPRPRKPSVPGRR